MFRSEIWSSQGVEDVGIALLSFSRRVNLQVSEEQIVSIFSTEDQHRHEIW
jgi:hypothetical protein